MDYDLDQLLEGCCSGLFCLINDSKEMVEVFHSKNIMEAVIRNITQMKHGLHDVRGLCEDLADLRVVILLKDVEDLQTRLLLQGYYTEYYKERGYKTYRSRKALEYKPKIEVDTAKVRVVLVNKRGSKIVVGLFEHMDEANEFLHKYYSNKYFLPVYANNDLTRNYFNRPKSRNIPVFEE